ncbi:MAG: hypothetical protein JSV52_15105 [Candidatus Zixiibacteriota bacterium]|nr:MAG: hypothetical protein JSV52_15105 [candidate division Zixibacteria bacterium]
MFDNVLNRTENWRGMTLKWISGSILLLLFFASSASTGGLRTQLGEVVVENLQIGQSYSLRDLANLSLRVINTSDYSVELRMDLLAPGEAELKHEAEPIPDLSWISLSCDSFYLESGKEAVSEIVMAIPDEERYLGKRYQFMIWSHTVPGSEGGMFLATGLKSRIIFTTDSVSSDRSAGLEVPSGSAAFAVLPTELHLDQVPGGTSYDIHMNTGTALLIKNPTDDELTLKLYSRTVGGSLASLEPGWEDTPDAGYLTFDANEVRIPPRAVRAVNPYLRVPEEAGLQGKKLMFVIHVCDETRQVITGVYVRVFAALK